MRAAFTEVVLSLLSEEFENGAKQRLCNAGMPSRDENWREQYIVAEVQQQQASEGPGPGQEGEEQQQQALEGPEPGQEGEQQQQPPVCGCGGSCAQARGWLGFSNGIPLASEAWTSLPAQRQVVQWLRGCQLLQEGSGFPKQAKAAQQLLKEWQQVEEGAASGEAAAARVASLARARAASSAAAEFRRVARAAAKKDSPHSRAAGSGEDGEGAAEGGAGPSSPSRLRGGLGSQPKPGDGTRPAAAARSSKRAGARRGQGRVGPTLGSLRAAGPAQQQGQDLLRGARVSSSSSSMSSRAGQGPRSLANYWPTHHPAGSAVARSGGRGDQQLS
jgi:hypothetical protein